MLIRPHQEHYKLAGLLQISCMKVRDLLSDVIAGSKCRLYWHQHSSCCYAEYEVDFITYFTKIANLGAQFDSNKYLYPITLDLPRIK